MSEHTYRMTPGVGVAVTVEWSDAGAASLRDALRIAGAIVNDARLREEVIAPKVVPVQIGADGGPISWMGVKEESCGSEEHHGAHRWDSGDELSGVVECPGGPPPAAPPGPAPEVDDGEWVRREP